MSSLSAFELDEREKSSSQWTCSRCDLQSHHNGGAEKIRTYYGGQRWVNRETEFSKIGQELVDAICNRITSDAIENRAYYLPPKLLNL